VVQLVDLLFVLILVVVLARRFPTIGGAVGRALGTLGSTRSGPPSVDEAPQGALVTVTCTGCLRSSPARARFCSHCGGSLLPSLN